MPGEPETPGASVEGAIKCRPKIVKKTTAGDIDSALADAQAYHSAWILKQISCSSSWAATNLSSPLEVDEMKMRIGERWHHRGDEQDNEGGGHR